MLRAHQRNDMERSFIRNLWIKYRKSGRIRRWKWKL